MRQVSWIRKRDSLVLTIDKLRLVDETRFKLGQAPDDRGLVLSQPRPTDAGLYECQVSSLEPKLSRLVELRMARAESSISNFSSLFVRPGELVRLTCSVRAPQPTSFVYWYKNAKEVVLFDSHLSRESASSSDGAGESRAARPKSSKLESGLNALSSPSSSVSVSSSTSSIASAKSSPSASASSKPGQMKNLISAHDKGARQRAGVKKSRPIEEEAGSVGAAAAAAAAANDEDALASVRSSSTLIIKQAQSNDTANYTCLVSTAGEFRHTGRRSRAPTAICTPRQGRPTRNCICRATFGRPTFGRPFRRRRQPDGVVLAR